MNQITVRTWWLTAILTFGIALSPGLAQECDPAGTVIQIQARTSGTDTVTVRYTVVNNSGESLRYIRIGAGGEGERTLLVPDQIPSMKEAPPGWRGIVVFPEETPFFHLWWEATAARTGIGPNRSENGFLVSAAGPKVIRPGLIGTNGQPVKPIDFARLPFKVCGSQGRCWCGRVSPAPQRGDE